MRAGGLTRQRHAGTDGRHRGRRGYNGVVEQLQQWNQLLMHEPMKVASPRERLHPCGVDDPEVSDRSLIVATSGQQAIDSKLRRGDNRGRILVWWAA